MAGIEWVVFYTLFVFLLLLRELRGLKNIRVYLWSYMVKNRTKTKREIPMKNFILSLVLVTLSLPAWAGDEKESAFDRVMRTGVIKCGYYVFPPVTYKDPNTGKLSGFTIDMMEEIGKRASLKIEWEEETNFSNWIPGLQTGRYDVSCTPNWPDIAQGRAAAFSIPMFYGGLYPMVRADDLRFNNNDSSILNSPDIIFVSQEGEARVSLIKENFPKAQLKLLGAGEEKTNFVMDLVTKKADAILTDMNGQIEFNRNNPEKLKLIGLKNPIKLQAFSLAVERHEMILNDFLNNAILDLINDGTMDRLLRKWEPEPGKTYLRVSSPAKVE